MRRVTISRDFDSWRRAARRLLMENVPPWGVDFDDGTTDFLPGIAEPPEPAAGGASAFRVPKRFLAEAKWAADHRDADRWNFLYRLLHRATYEPRMMDNLTDPDVRRLAVMTKAVHRDEHKMHAFVRFRKVEGDGGVDQYVAFHRPDHYIVRRVAPFFRERFGGMRWAILTPDDSVSWDGTRLAFGAGVPASAAPDADALEAAWLTYYANIFNPARIKLDAMRAEMPKKHWPTLPETRIIPDLLQQAPERVERMMAVAAKNPKTSAAEFLPEQHTIPAMRAAVQACRGCELCEQPGVTQAVFGEGPPQARCVFVGEQPGDTEDKAGKPFVGPAGQLLNELLDEAGVDRSLVYVTNSVKHFRFEQKGRLRLHQKPLARHVNACKPWLEAELEAVSPKMIVALGSTAAQAIKGRDFRVTQSRGEVSGCPYGDWFMATIHPSAILRVPDDAARGQAKADFAADMRLVARRMKEVA